jgi:ClpP class serine protease
MDNLFNLFWVFLIISTLQPIIRQKILEAARVRMLRRLEQLRGSRVITLIHRQETLALLGFPLARYIDINDSEAVLRAIKLTGPDIPIDMILHTPGGLVLAAEQIARALCRHKGKVTVFVPHYAMSGGTLIALAADEIVMDDNAVLGPVDPQIGQYPAVSIITAAEQKPVAEVDDTTLIMADISRKALRQVRQVVLDILSLNNIPRERAEPIGNTLTSGVWTHDYPISVDEARQLGLPISTEMPASRAAATRAANRTI